MWVFISPGLLYKDMNLFHWCSILFLPWLNSWNIKIKYVSETFTN
jgi:hypothetical protein